jgi:hypothetical protein
MPTGLMPTACQRGESWIIFSPTSCDDDRAEEVVFLGNDLTMPNFWMYSFRAGKVMMLSDAKHWHHICLSCILGMLPIVLL